MEIPLHWWQRWDHRNPECYINWKENAPRETVLKVTVETRRNQPAQTVLKVIVEPGAHSRPTVLKATAESETHASFSCFKSDSEVWVS